MKLQIKTLKQKSLVIDIEDSKTVYDLKKELSFYPDIGVKPELQNLIYAGQVLVNETTLNSYNIDVKKFLVIMLLKQPIREPPPAIKSEQLGKEDTSKASDTNSTSAASGSKDYAFETPPAAADGKKQQLVSDIVAMGYPETDVRRALAASFYNAERAIEYLIEGIPTSPSTPEGESFNETDVQPTPFEIFRRSDMFKKLRKIIHQNPKVMEDTLTKISQTDPELLDTIAENEQEFLSMILESSDEGDGDDAGDDMGVE